MKRMILLLLPVVTLGVGVPDTPARSSREESTGLLWQASLTAETNGDVTGALDKLGAYMKNGGDPFLGWLRAGWLNYSDKKYDDAARDYGEAAKVHPGALNPRLGLLAVAQARNDGAAAIAAAEAVLKVEPTNYRALMAVAWGAYQGKDYKRSATAYQRVLALYPEDATAISGAAWCAFYAGKKLEAKDGFHRLMSLNPADTYVRQGIAATGR